jgi:nucleotide-binding universal stress UspA family protein
MAMFRTILTHMTGTDCDQPVLAMASQIARNFSGHLECLRVVADPTALVMQTAQLDLVTSALLADTLDVVELQNRETTQRARVTLAEFCKREGIVFADEPPGPNGVSAHWQENPGDELDELTSQTRFHDLVVLAGGAERKGRLSPEGIGQIIIGAGRPVILAPEKASKSLTKTIAIAWKNTPEAARAITAAMPLLTKAERIEVLSANEEDTRAMECVDCSDGVVQQLRWHGLNASSHFVIPAGRTVPHAILESAHGVKADLLVMGGYGNSRFREFIFGGFTKRILDGVDLPVLVFH